MVVGVAIGLAQTEQLKVEDGVQVEVPVDVVRVAFCPAQIVYVEPIVVAVGATITIAGTLALVQPATVQVTL